LGVKALFGLILAVLLVGAGAALVAFEWSPLRDLVATDRPAQRSGAGDEVPPPDGGRAPAPAPARGGEYSGTGSKSLGTIEVSRPSVLRWTTTGESGIRSFAVMDDDFRINVSVQGETGGQSRVEPGTYRNVTVNAVGDWTMSIEPG
jgi:hypothetical protein